MFNTALGWFRAIRADPEVDSLIAVNSRGLHDIKEDHPLSDLSKLESEPDITIVVRGYQVHKLSLKNGLPGTRSALILTDEPYETEAASAFNSGENQGLYDLVAVNDSATVHRHSSGVFMPCASDETVLPPKLQPKWDIGFVGTTDKKREAWLSTIDRACPGASWCLVGPKWKPKTWDKRSSHCQRVRMSTGPAAGYLSPKEVADLYAQCRIVLNVHRDGDANSPNPRTFDGIAYGLPIVQDHRPDTPESVVQFHDPGSMANFVREYLNGDAECVKRLNDSIKKGLEVRSEHTYTARWAELKSRLADRS